VTSVLFVVSVVYSMSRRILAGILVAALLPANASPQQTIGTCPILPANNIWNTPVDTLPVLANSDALVNTIGANTGFHADFGAGMWNGGPIGIPFITVPGTQTKYPATFQYDDESDPGPYAVPLNTPIEGGSNSNGDRHAIAIDTDNCILYELYRAFPQTSSWTAGSGAIFDLKSNALRPETWTSADAAGLPITPGLVTFEEVLSGEIRHAIRFTAPETRRAYVWPARHYASDLTGAQYPRMGERFRLKASFNISTFPAEVQVILRAMKKYGIILADNGSPWFISGKPDPRWNDDNLHTFGQLLGSNFEAVDATVLRISEDSGEAIQPGYEGDTAPRMSGNNLLTLADWVQTGRFATGLDTVSGSEFQRADCAPRETRGNGVLSIADWVQAGRYAAGLDAPVPVGGPAAPNTLDASHDELSTLASRGFGTTRSATIAASPTVRAGIAMVAVWVEASGVENAIAVSVSFDQSQWEFVEAKTGGDAVGATLVTNTRQLEMGRIGIAVALPPGRTVAAGWRAIVELSLRRVNLAGERLPMIEINDAPVIREVVDVWGNSLHYEWQSLSGRRDKTR
jgi:hypothetical protein